MDQAQSPLTITSLEVDSIKRVRVARITPDGSLVVIGGRNAQGKSSCLDAIEMLMGGKGVVPPEPIHRGKRRGHIVARLGDGTRDELVVVRKFTASGGTELEVKSADGSPKRSPQSILDALCNAISFDPLEFSRMRPEKQDAVLKQLLNIDFTLLDQKRKAAYEERAHVNRDIKALQARIAAAPRHPNAPKAEVSVAELAAKLKAAQDANAARAEQERVIQSAREAIESARARVAQLEQELATARATLEAKVAAHDQATEALEKLPHVETSAIEAQLATVEATNSTVRENQQRLAMETELDALERKAEALSDTVLDVDDQKAQILGAAKFPVPGLGFDDSGPTLNGLPLEQASTAEKLRLSVAIGFAMQPRLKVLLVREGSALDSEGMRLLAELAEQHGGQCWVERVSEDGAGCSVVLEDGEVRSEAKAAE